MKGAYLLSIVIPTFNEGLNVFTIAARIRATLPLSSYEILFLDDSLDDTPSLLEALTREDDRVRFLHRTGKRGLALAVLEGFDLARGEVIAVMDCDLQHPPELLPDMLREIERGADIVIPSRFIPGGSAGKLSLFRRAVSFVARMLATVSVSRLRPVSDSTSGLFMLRRAVLEGAKFEPIGWKILIEVLAKAHYRQVVEIPYLFYARRAGESKMNLREQWNYLRHLAALIRSDPFDRRSFFLRAALFLAFLAVLREPHPYGWCLLPLAFLLYHFRRGEKIEVTRIPPGNLAENERTTEAIRSTSR